MKRFSYLMSALILLNCKSRDYNSDNSDNVKKPISVTEAQNTPKISNNDLKILTEMLDDPHADLDDAIETTQKKSKGTKYILGTGVGVLFISTAAFIFSKFRKGNAVRDVRIAVEKATGTKIKPGMESAALEEHIKKMGLEIQEYNDVFSKQARQPKEENAMKEIDAYWNAGKKDYSPQNIGIFQRALDLIENKLNKIKRDTTNPEEIKLLDTMSKIIEDGRSILANVGKT